MVGDYTGRVRQTNISSGAERGLGLRWLAIHAMHAKLSEHSNRSALVAELDTHGGHATYQSQRWLGITPGAYAKRISQVVPREDSGCADSRYMPRTRSYRSIATGVLSLLSLIHTAGMQHIRVKGGWRLHRASTPNEYLKWPRERTRAALTEIVAQRSRK